MNYLLSYPYFIYWFTILIALRVLSKFIIEFINPEKEKHKFKTYKYILENLDSFSDKYHRFFKHQYREQGRRIGISYLLLIFLGHFGAHQYYLLNYGDNTKGRSAVKYYFSLFLTAIVFLFSGYFFEGQPQLSIILISIGFLTETWLLGLILWDILTLPYQVYRRNEEIKELVITQILNEDVILVEDLIEELLANEDRQRKFVETIIEDRRLNKVIKGILLQLEADKISKIEDKKQSAQ